MSAPPKPNRRSHVRMSAELLTQIDDYAHRVEARALAIGLPRPIKHSEIVRTLIELGLARGNELLSDTVGQSSAPTKRVGKRSS